MKFNIWNSRTQWEKKFTESCESTYENFTLFIFFYFLCFGNFEPFLNLNVILKKYIVYLRTNMQLKQLSSEIKKNHKNKTKLVQDLNSWQTNSLLINIETQQIKIKSGIYASDNHISKIELFFRHYCPVHLERDSCDSLSILNTEDWF